MASGGLSPGHARALLAIQDESQRLAAIEQIQGMSVRQAEKYARQLNQPAEPEKLMPTQAPTTVDYLAEAARGLESQLGRKVRIEQGKKSGTVTLEFYGADDLERLLEALKRLTV